MLTAITEIDSQILIYIQENIRCGWLTPIMKFITTLGNAGMFWIVLSVVLLLFKKTRPIGLTCALALLFSLLVNNMLIKNIVARPRPYTVISNLTILVSKPGEFSFPSGHTASSFAAATVLFYTVKSKWGIVAMVWAALIGFSRLYVGVHYPTDVICGMLSGIILGVVAVKISEGVSRKLEKV